MRMRLAAAFAVGVGVSSLACADSYGPEDLRLDSPGRVHHVRADSLPRPYATPSAQNPPQIVKQPADAELHLPLGFKAELFATGFSGPRKMLLAPNGDVIVSDTYAGRIVVLRPAADGRSVATRDIFAAGLNTPYGLAFYPDAAHAAWLYVAETGRVVRFAYRSGDLRARVRAESVVASLPSGGGHVTRDIAFSGDGTRLFVSVGSGSNVAETMPRKTPADLREWQAHHALGGAWDQEMDRAAVLEFRVGESGPPQAYASGIRNCVSLTMQPATGSLWCTTNERDDLGDDLVPDYSTRVVQGAFYGWPWYYTGSHEDPRHAGERPELAGKVSVPDVLYQAHSAALGLTFYTASSGASAFPAEYVGDGFVTLHGSWNRRVRTGHKLVRMRMHGGEPTGEYVDFLTGFVVDDHHVWGRPVATAELADGSLLMSEDGGDVIYRISYRPRAAP
jgi:glucose/arabinose dehydrogenase